MVKMGGSRTQAEVVSELGVCAAGDAREAEAGIRVLAAGGNAVDAVVAAAFTGFVVEPASCGLGGSGHLALFLSETGEFVSVDHNVRAPGAARADLFEVDPEAQPNYYGGVAVAGRRNEWGHLAVAVPGAVSGLCAAHERWGRLPLAQLLEPAIEAAEAGVPVTWSLILTIVDRLEEIATMPHAEAFLLREGRPPRLGEVLDTSELAQALREIAAHGVAGFYSGWVAEAIASELRKHGGLVTVADLAAYRPKTAAEEPASYRGYRYATASDPVGYETMNILDCFDLARYGPDGVEYRHLMAEALGHAFADNIRHYGDPDVVASPVNGLSSREFAAGRAAAIRLDRAAPRPVAPGDPWPYEHAAAREGAPVLGSAAREGGSTSHMAVADRHGNLAALCTTLTTGFGSLVLVPGTGIFLNNTMQDYDPRPGRPNSIAPGKMPMFAVPTLVAAREGRGVLAAAGAGGYRITTGVLHPLVNVVDFAMSVQEAVDAPRVHCQGNETFVDSRIPEPVRDRLAELGHDVVVQAEAPGSINFARVGAVRRDPGSGLLEAGAGPSWAAAAAGL